MLLSLKMHKETLIVALQGELDHHGANDVRDAIEHAIRTGPVKHLIFDFSGLSFMDSSGIGMVIGRYKLIRALGGKVLLVCPKGRMGQIIEMSGLSKLVSIHKKIDDAIKEVYAE